MRFNLLRFAARAEKGTTLLMTTNANAGAGDPGAAAEIDRLPGAITSTNSQTKTNAQVVRAELFGADTCSANGISVQGSAPVLALCKTLLAAGLDPDAALRVYRGAVLALRSIGEGSRLEVNGKGTGFKYLPAVGTASPERQIEEAA
jgi:hypothetical protein